MFAPRRRSVASVASSPAAVSASSGVTPALGESAMRAPRSVAAAGWRGASAASSAAQSSIERAIGPGWSSENDSGTRPRVDSRPRVGLKAEVPQKAEGMRSEPAVSVPVAAGTMPAASAAAEPPEEPPALRASAQGLPTWSVVPPAANSCVCRWPSRTMPAPRNRAQTSQSRVGVSFRMRLEAVSGLPATP